MDPAFEEFVRGSLPALGRYAYALTGATDRAADLVQDTFERISRAWRRVRQDGQPLAYARTVMFRTYVSSWRASLRRPVQVPLPDIPVASDVYAAVEQRDLLRRAMAKLPRSQRAVLVLTYLDDATEADIAAVLDCRPATVRSLRHRGLLALRAELGLPAPAAPGATGRGQ